MHANVTVLTSLHPHCGAACIYVTVPREVLETLEAEAVVKTFLSDHCCLIRQCCFQQSCLILVPLKYQAFPGTRVHCDLCNVLPSLSIYENSVCRYSELF